MRGRVRRGLAAVLLAVAVAGCATFPDEGPREWQDRIEGAGDIGGLPRIPETDDPLIQPPTGQAPESGTPEAPSPCADPDPQVVATCLDPVGAIAVLPDSESALVGERATGRVLLVRRDVDAVLIATVPVDPSGGGGLTGLVLSPSYAEDQLVYAYTTTAEDNRVMLIAPGEAPKPLFTGIPRGPVHNSGALGVDVDGSLLVATGDAGGGEPDSLAGKLLRIDTLGRPAAGNPDPASAVLSSGLVAPGGVCTDPLTTMTWVTDRTGTADVLHRVEPGPLPPPVWRWPDRPGVGGCAAGPGVVTVAQAGAAALYVLRPDDNGTFVGDPETLLDGMYGQLWAATAAPDGLLWLGTVNKDGGEPVPSDDRVIRIQPPSGGGASRA